MCTSTQVCFVNGSFQRFEIVFTLQLAPERSNQLSQHLTTTPIPVLISLQSGRTTQRRWATAGSNASARRTRSFCDFWGSLAPLIGLRAKQTATLGPRRSRSAERSPTGRSRAWLEMEISWWTDSGRRNSLMSWKKTSMQPITHVTAGWCIYPKSTWSF